MKEKKPKKDWPSWQERRDPRHHPFGPSRRYIRRMCVGSYGQEMRLAYKAEGYCRSEAADTPEAKMGRKGHAFVPLTRYALEQGRDEPELRHLARLCQDVRDELLEGAEEIHHEKRVVLKAGRPSIPPGTPDVVGVYPEELRIIEWKFGYEEAPAEMLVPQLEHQAALAMFAYKRAKARCWCYQPRHKLLFELERPLVDREAIRDAIRAEVRACKRKDAPLTPGIIQCRWCRAIRTCPAVRKGVQVLLDGKCRPSPERVVDAVAAISIEKLPEAMWWVPLVEKLCSEVRNRVKATLRAGFEVPGWELERRRGNRFIPDTATAIARLVDHEVPLAEILKCVDVSLTHLDSLWLAERKRKDPKTTKTSAQEALERVLGDVLLRAPDKEVLTRKKEA